MSKTIDVREGDEWTMWPGDEGLYQYRNRAYRYVDRDHISAGWGSLRKDAVEVSIPACAAEVILTSWGYTLTRSDAAKPADAPPTVKENLTTDVPEVDAVWVEWTNSAGNKCLLGHTDEESAKNANRSDFANGTARIVRIRTVDEQARAELTVAQEQIKALGVWCKELESRLADTTQLATDARDRGRKANERLDALEKPTPTGVVAPRIEPKNYDDRFDRGREWQDRAWREALASQGIKVEDAE